MESMKTKILRYHFVAVFMAIANILNCQYQPYVNPDARSINTGYAVGATSGSLSVNSRGEAVYEIPVFTSPGTAGMVPSIRILYNSNYKDGILGPGWTIAGLSSIHRVPRNFYNDSTRKGITLTLADRFALDSNRLVLSSGVYGGDQSVYKTEIETFSRITARGVSGDGPSWFNVETKDGQTIEYGNTPDSKVEAYGTTTVYLWRVNKITDRYGNYIKFTYNEINGESYLSKIDYTGNGSGTQPYNSLKFFYNARNDVNNPYVGGRLVPSTVILSSIRMEAEGTLVREYQMKYFSDSFNKTRLNEIKELGNDGSSLNSTLFGWTETVAAFSNADVFSPNQISTFYFGDFNGDGRKDFIWLRKKSTYLPSDTWKVYLADAGSSGFNLIYTGTVGAGYKGIVIADNDGDGMDNIYLHRVTNYLTYNFENYKYDQNSGTVVRNQPADFFLEEIVIVNTLTGDFDGNGKTDLLILDASKNYLAASGITVATGGMPGFNSPDAIRTLDFDGDGRDELLVIKNSNSFIYQYDNLSQIFNTVYSSSTFPVKDDRIFIGDFNGDLKDDILSYRGGWSLKFSTGTGFQVSGNVPALRNFDPAASILDNNYYIGDFNGDGMDDILEAYKSGSSSILKVYASYGNGKTTVFSNTYTKSAINQDYLNIGGFSGKGCDQVFYYDNSLSANKVNLVSFFSGTPPVKINKIYDGLDNKIKIAYKRLNEDAFFYGFLSWSNAYPVIILKNNYQAVSSVSRSGGVFNNGTETERIVTYSYEGLNVHRLGRNNLGFSMVKEHDSATERTSKTKYVFDQVYFFISSKVIFDDEFSANSIYVTNWSRKEYGNKVILPFISNNLSFDPLTGFQSGTGYTLDNYGNLTYKSTVSKKPRGFPECTESVTFSGYSAYGNWGVPNKPQSILISRSVRGQSAVTKEVGFTYDSNGRILTETTYPGTAKAVIKTYTYNLNGNIVSATESGQGVLPRVSSYQYDSKNRFITSNQQPDSSSVSYTRDPATGNALTETGIDSKTTTYQYDAFGRLKKVITPIGHEIVTSINWENVLPDIPARYKVQTTAPGRPDVINYYDKLGRIVRAESEAPGGMVFQDKYYNPDGTTEKVAYPYRSGDTQKWIEYGYDEYGRLISEDNNSLITTYYYGNDTTKITLPSGKTKTTIFNSQSQVIQVIDNDNTVTTYNYNSFGNVSAITTPGNSVSFHYDTFGLQDSSYNKNSGGMKFTYNAFGELLSLKDARGLSTMYQYDVLGRITQQTSPEGTGSYSYYHSGNGIRQLAAITGPGGVTEGFTYDNFGRVSQYSRSITNEISMNLSYGYDQYGNNTSITYPSGLVILNVFDQYGNLTEIRKSDGKLIWQLNSITATGKPAEVTVGPGTFTRSFEYDTYENISSIVSGDWRQSFNFDGASGNLMSRSYKNGDSTFMRTESFQYDTRERLTTSQVTGQGQRTVTYDQTGNILTKTDAGTYYYSSTKVNALATITFVRGAISTDLQTIAYNSQNKATDISEDVNSYDIVYGADGERIKSQLYTDSVLTKTKYYAPGYEKITTAAGTVENHYISSQFGLEAIIVKSGASETMYLAETDHLGSLIGLRDTAGVYVERYSYDPWGRRRNPSDWSFTNVPAPTITDRGFTGHEHLDMFGLINANGRLYDPVTGRFLNSDPVIDNIGGAQGLNSYTYCLNNPLKYIDPSGYVFRRPPEVEWVNLSEAYYTADRITPGRAYGGGSPWVGGYLAAVHASIENGYNITTSKFNEAYSEQSNSPDFDGTISVQTGIIDYYTFVSFDKGKTWHQGNYINSKAIYSTFNIPSGGGGDPLPTWSGWINSGTSAAAYGATVKGGSAGILNSSGAVRYYPNAWTGNQYIKTFNLTKVGTGVGYGTSAFGFFVGGYNFAVSDKSWGDYGQLGISLLSSGLTLSGYTAPIGIGIGLIDVAGGFIGFYNYLDTQQQFYNSTGGVMLPVNNVSTFISIRRP